MGGRPESNPKIARKLATMKKIHVTPEELCKLKDCKIDDILMVSLTISQYELLASVKEHKVYLSEKGKVTVWSEDEAVNEAYNELKLAKGRNDELWRINWNLWEKIRELKNKTETEKPKPAEKNHTLTFYFLTFIIISLICLNLFT